MSAVRVLPLTESEPTTTSEDAPQLRAGVWGSPESQLVLLWRILACRVLGCQGY